MRRRGEKRESGTLVLGDADDKRCSIGDLLVSGLILRGPDLIVERAFVKVVDNTDDLSDRSG